MESSCENGNVTSGCLRGMCVANGATVTSTWGGVFFDFDGCSEVSL